MQQKKPTIDYMLGPTSEDKTILEHITTDCELYTSGFKKIILLTFYSIFKVVYFSLKSTYFNNHSIFLLSVGSFFKPKGTRQFLFLLQIPTATRTCLMN